GTVGWRTQEGNVARLRRRIFTAARERDWAKVRNLQKLMLRSRSNTLVSVRQVTQRNAGRKTAGIDGEVALTSPKRAEVAVRVHSTIRSWNPRAVRRVFIPKSSDRTKLRPLGIPVLMDRCHQARVRNALEPEWEARFEARSYGFRPGRGCHDAIEATFNALCRKDAKRVWILDADLAAAFDRIDHSRLLDALSDFPARRMVADWLKAGVFEPGKGFTPTEEGTPRGGVISPVLLSVAPRGLEEAAGVRYHTGRRAGESVAGSPVLIRYADDMIAFCHSQGQADQVKARLAEWLKPRGLVFNEDKTRIGHPTQGFEFLGFHIRRYPNGKLLIKPSPKAVKRVKRQLADEMRSLRGSNVSTVLARLIPIVRGWAAYRLSWGSFSVHPEPGPSVCLNQLTRSVVTVADVPRFAAFETSGLRNASSVSRLPWLGRSVTLLCVDANGVVQRPKRTPRNGPCWPPRRVRTWCCSLGRGSGAKTSMWWTTFEQPEQRSEAERPHCPAGGVSAGHCVVTSAPQGSPVGGVVGCFRSGVMNFRQR
ncbi:MAG: reverse transcriptase domain-containing protein, partial [Pseudonocardiaceae bacterium]